MVGFAGPACTSRPAIAYGEIVNLALSIVSTGKVNSVDMRRLLRWSREHRVDPNEWPAGALVRRFSRVCQKPVATEEEIEDLLALLDDLSGTPAWMYDGPAAGALGQAPTAVTFANREFVFTGRFLYGVDHCVEDLWPRGARHAATVSADTDYLVIGSLQRKPRSRSSLAGTRTVHITEADFLHAVATWRPTATMPRVSGPLRLSAVSETNTPSCR